MLNIILILIGILFFLGSIVLYFKTFKYLEKRSLKILMLMVLSLIIFFVVGYFYFAQTMFFDISLIIDNSLMNLVCFLLFGGSIFVLISICLIFLGFKSLYQRKKELDKNQQEKSNIFLEKETELNRKVEEKTIELSQKIEELGQFNLRQSRNEDAMINLLEDAQELQIQLQKEKTGVETKVLERTKELSETKAKLDSSIENLPLGFLMVDIEERLIITNSLAKKMLGGKKEKDNLDKLKIILKDKIDLADYIKNCGKDKKRETFADVEIEGKFYQFLLSPILTKEIEKVCIGIVVLIQDITEVKILDRSKDEFFSIASHELRTPLTAIRGNTSMILEYYAENIKDPELKAMVDDIHESSIRLINIVNDFLNVSRLEQKRMVFDIKKFNIEELIPEIIKEYDVTGSRKGVDIDFVKPKIATPEVKADPDKIRQVLINLLGNALKFTEKGKVTINIEKNEKQIKVLVSDTGRGISLKQQNLLFHKFQQAGSSLFTRDTAGGSGLGLYISKMMMDGMGGEIKLEKSEENKGSTFSFSLPIF